MYLLFFLVIFCYVASAKSLGGDRFGESFLAKQSNGQVYAWGHNEYGMLGIGSNYYNVLNPTKLPGVSFSTDLSVGRTSSCIVDQGQAKCAGSGYYLGRGSTRSDSNVMVNVEGLDEAGAVSQMFLGHGHSCLLTISGTVWCWADAVYGQLANPATEGYSVPGKVAGYGADKMASEIAAGIHHTCILLSDGTVGCGGRNQYGQLGVGDTEDRSTLTKVQGGLAKVVSISAGFAHTCAVTQNGDVYCWGTDNYGQLGLGGNVYQKVPPMKVPGMPAAAAEVWCGSYATFVILQGNRRMVGFGQNFYGTLIEGVQSELLDPTALYKGQNGILEVRGGFFTTCILLESGKIKCLGSNEYSQLGRHTSMYSFNPLGQVNGIPATSAPTRKPTRVLTVKPTRAPTAEPTKKPSKGPTVKPTRTPTLEPTAKPTKPTTALPTHLPTLEPTQLPSETPSAVPTLSPTRKPTKPTKRPTFAPTRKPTREPTVKPTRAPTGEPTTKPSKSPSPAPIKKPTKELTAKPTKKAA